MEVFVHGVDSLLCAVRVHVALYVMRCDHGHNSINRLNWLSDNGHAARALAPAPHGRRASGGMKRPASAWGQRSGSAVRERWPATRLSSPRRFPGHAGELAPGAHHKHNCQDPKDGCPYQFPVKMGREDGADCPSQSQGPSRAPQGANSTEYRYRTECFSKCDTDRKRPR